MDITDLEGGLRYRGRVAAVRQTYYVFEASDYYFVLSFSRTKEGAGNFNIVPRTAVDYVRKRFGGRRGVTSRGVVDRARRTSHVPSTLVALNVLYVLVAIGGAEIQREGERRKLFFNVKRAPA